MVGGDGCGVWEEASQRATARGPCPLICSWKKGVKVQKLHRHQAFLGTHLLLAVPHLGVGLLHISRLLQELRSVSWFPREADQCFELLDLQRALARENHRALRLLHRCLHLCTAVLRLVRGSSLSPSLLPRSPPQRFSPLLAEAPAELWTLH